MIHISTLEYVPFFCGPINMFLHQLQELLCPMPKLFLQNSAQKLRTTRKCKDGFYYNKGFLSFPIRKSRTESTESQDGGFTKIPFSEGRRFEPHSSRQFFFFCNFCIFPFYFETTLLNKCKKCNKKNLFSTMGFEPATHSRGCFY